MLTCSDFASGAGRTRISPSAPPPRRARRRGAAAARLDPAAAHLQAAVGGLGDRAHRGEAIDAHAHVDFGDRRARQIECRHQRRRIVVDEYAHALDAPMRVIGKAQRQRRRRRIRRVGRYFQAHEGSRRPRPSAFRRNISRAVIPRRCWRAAGLRRWRGQSPAANRIRGRLSAAQRVTRLLAIMTPLVCHNRNENRRRNLCVADSNHRDYIAHLNQKNRMPPSAKSFSLASLPPCAVDLVLMYSPTSVTLFVRL